MPFTPAPTTGDDVLTDTAGNDSVDALAGNDRITVTGGSDSVNGGADRDRLIVDYSGATQAVANRFGILDGNLASGHSGDFLGGDRSVSFFGIEDFTITTGGGNDNIRVGGGDDVVNLGGGDDFVDFGTGNDSGDGGTGTDGFSANLGSATAAISIDLQTGVSTTFSNFEYLGTLTTGSGNDTIVTRNIARNETVTTGAGADTITVAGGSDSVTGGADRDRLIVDYSGATQAVANRFGILDGNLASGHSGDFLGGDRAVSFFGIEDFTITTAGGNDNIRVGGGDDVVNLGGGDDVVDFGTGNDSGDGGTGTDGFSANLTGVTTALTIDLVTGTSNVFRNFEYVGTLTTGSGNDTVTTRAENRAETINTSDGDDVITVQGGSDTVNGGAGNDRLIIIGGDNLGNSVALSGSLATGYSGTIGGGGLSVAFQGIENFTIRTSNNSSDNITTGDGEDEYSQRALDSSTYIRDTANLGGGIDRIAVDARGTNGALSIAAGFNGAGEVFLYGNGKLGFTGAERFFLQGGNAGDDLRGLDYADRFDGNAGNDRIAGRGGNDELNGGAGLDIIDGDGRVTMLLAADNQNNAGTGVSDNDFRVTGTYNIANPAEFDLAVGTGKRRDRAAAHPRHRCRGCQQSVPGRNRRGVCQWRARRHARPDCR